MNKWIKVSDQLPESERKVIAFYRNKYDKPRTIMAFHTDKFIVEGNTDNEDILEYDEATDTYYLQEGWYEIGDFFDYYYQVNAEITHWMELPDDPVKVT